VIEWQPEGKRLRGRPRKRWLDIIEEDLKTVGVKEWKEIIQDREKWRDIVLAAKILIELYGVIMMMIKLSFQPTKILSLPLCNFNLISLVWNPGVKIGKSK
jgi:hypothetical protein